MVEYYGFDMAASNTQPTVQNGSAVSLSFQCQPEVNEDQRCDGNCEDHQQFRAEFLSAK